MPNGSQSGSKPFFFKGQKDLGNELFAKNGPFQALLNGAPDPGFEAGAARSQQALQRQLTDRGMGDSGQPLNVLSQQNLQRDIALGRESNRLQTLLGSVQPAGTLGTSSAGKWKV